jgi:hypothetical protein
MPYAVCRSLGTEYFLSRPTSISRLARLARLALILALADWLLLGLTGLGWAWLGLLAFLLGSSLELLCFLLLASFASAVWYAQIFLVLSDLPCSSLSSFCRPFWSSWIFPFGLIQQTPATSAGDQEPIRPLNPPRLHTNAVDSLYGVLRKGMEYNTRTDRTGQNGPGLALQDTGSYTCICTSLQQWLTSTEYRVQSAECSCRIAILNE